MNFENMTTREILYKYEFPHRFLVYFASQCAKDSQRSNKNPDPRTLTAIDVAERFGNGEEFTPGCLKRVREGAYATYAAAYAAADATYAAAYAAYAAYAAADATCAAASYATAATYAAATYATYDAASAAAVDEYKPLLLSLIEARLTELESVLIFS